MIGGAVVLLAVASLVSRPLRVRVSTIGSVDHLRRRLRDRHLAVVRRPGPRRAHLHRPCRRDGRLQRADHHARRRGDAAHRAGGRRLSQTGGHHGRGVPRAGPDVRLGGHADGLANDLIIIFLGLEILSIALYVLTAFNHRQAASGEAALKYFILGGFSSAIFVYGIALTYGATGSTNLTQIADFLSKNVVLTNGLLLAGLALMLVGFAFKVAAVPFHMWTPDVYEGAPTPVTGFMAAVAKAGAFAALLRVLFSSLGVISSDWKPIIYGLAVLSLLVGSVVALRQRDVKRMLAYSSINHAGFILLGVESALPRGVSASLYYLVAYMFMTIGSFAVVTVLGRQGDGDHDLTRYRGLARRQPLLALSFAILLLAQAGAPFTTGLWAKLQVVLAAVSAGAVPLAVIAMVTAAIAAFFYLRVAVLMYASNEPEEGGEGVVAPAGPHRRRRRRSPGPAPTACRRPSPP